RLSRQRRVAQAVRRNRSGSAHLTRLSPAEQVQVFVRHTYAGAQLAVAAGENAASLEHERLEAHLASPPGSQVHPVRQPGRGIERAKRVACQWENVRKRKNTRRIEPPLGREQLRLVVPLPRRKSKRTPE